MKQDEHELNSHKSYIFQRGKLIEILQREEIKILIKYGLGQR